MQLIGGIRFDATVQQVHLRRSAIPKAKASYGLWIEQFAAKLRPLRTIWLSQRSTTLATIGEEPRQMPLAV